MATSSWCQDTLCWPRRWIWKKKSCRPDSWSRFIHLSLDPSWENLGNLPWVKFSGEILRKTFSIRSIFLIKDPIFHLKILPGNPAKSAQGQILRKTFSCQPSIRWIFLINDTACFKPIFFGLESSIVQEYRLWFEIIQGQFQPREQKGIVPPVAEGSRINTLLSVRSI